MFNYEKLQVFYQICADYFEYNAECSRQLRTVMYESLRHFGQKITENLQFPMHHQWQMISRNTTRHMRETF